MSFVTCPHCGVCSQHRRGRPRAGKPGPKPKESGERTTVNMNQPVWRVGSRWHTFCWRCGEELIFDFEPRRQKLCNECADPSSPASHGNTAREVAARLSDA
jgi:hypothetical protein